MTKKATVHRCVGCGKALEENKKFFVISCVDESGSSKVWGRLDEDCHARLMPTPDGVLSALRKAAKKATKPEAAEKAPHGA